MCPTSSSHTPRLTGDKAHERPFDVWQPQITSNSAADATRWVQYSHYSLPATVEAIFNLGTLGRNDTSATPMSDLFRGGIP